MVQLDYMISLGMFSVFSAVNDFNLIHAQLNCRRQGPVAELLTQWKANIGYFDGRGSELLCDAVVRYEH